MIPGPMGCRTCDIRMDTAPRSLGVVAVPISTTPCPPDGRILTPPRPEPNRIDDNFGGASSASPPMPTCRVRDSQSSPLQTMAPRGSVKMRPSPI
jgi:hypothetical protein